jgi:ribosomal protein S18 acetylase RimI-like enzyme
MPGHSYVVRPATASDAEVIASVWLRSRKTSIPRIPEPVHSDEEVRRWVSDVLLPNGGTWVVENESEVIGMMSIRDGWIDHLYVDPWKFGQGSGTRLLGHAKQLSPRGLDLWTFQSNVRARHFYETHGFRPVEMTQGDNEEGEPDVRYHWDG